MDTALRCILQSLKHALLDAQLPVWMQCHAWRSALQSPHDESFGLLMKHNAGKSLKDCSTQKLKFDLFTIHH